MKLRDIVLAIIVVGLLLVLFQRLRDTSEEPQLSDNEVPIEDVEEKLEDILGRQIPDDVEKADLEPQAVVDGEGLVTREVEEDEVVLSVLADLPEPPNGEAYQAWASAGGDAQPVSIGVLSSVKGGWVLDYTTTQEAENITEILVSREESVDSTPEEIILKATFN